MGQARLRGTKEERIAQAIIKKYNTSKLHRVSVEDICNEFDISSNALAKGYLISIDYPNKTQFLVSYKVTDNQDDFEYCAYPGSAMIFENFDYIAKLARAIAKYHKTDICFAFETDNKFEIIPVIAVDSPNIS